MAYFLPESAPGESHLTAKNRVWGFFAEPNKTRPGNRRQVQELHRENRPVATKPASGVFYYGYRFYDPNTGRWPSRDPINERGGKNLYGFVGNDGIQQFDVLGMRVLTIVIHYHGFEEGVINEVVKNEFERIFNDCFEKCKKKCHEVKYKWVDEAADADHYNDIGKEGHFLGFAPDEVHYYVRENPYQKMPGYSDGNKSSINTKIIKDDANDPVKGIAVVLAHEIGFHSIAGDADWWLSDPVDWDGKNSNPDKEFVDSKHPFASGGQNFSKPACEEICDELDID